MQVFQVFSYVCCKYFICMFAMATHLFSSFFWFLQVFLTYVVSVLFGCYKSRSCVAHVANGTHLLHLPAAAAGVPRFLRANTVVRWNSSMGSTRSGRTKKGNMGFFPVQRSLPHEGQEVFNFLGGSRRRTLVTPYIQLVEYGSCLVTNLISLVRIANHLKMIIGDLKGPLFARKNIMSASCKKCVDKLLSKRWWKCLYPILSSRHSCAT
jgi:hypothetical protein